MAYNVVSLILDITDGTGALVNSGSVRMVPSAQLTDSTDNLLVIEAPTWATLTGVAAPKLSLLATDNANILPSGWAWTMTFPGVPGNPVGFDVFLPAAPQTFTATNGTPCVFTGSGAGYPNNTGVQLSGGSLPAGFSAGTTYWTVSGSGSTFELAATVGGSPLASTGTGSGSVVAVSSYLSTLAPVSSVTTMAAYMPLPSGTASAGQVPVATGAGSASAWDSLSAAGIMPQPSGTATKGFVPVATGTGEASAWGGQGGVTVTVPAPAGATATDTPAITAAITTLATALASGPATLQLQDGTYQVDSNALVIRSPNTTTVASASNGAEPSTWVPGSAGTLTVASATGFPSSGQLWLAASGNTVALISYTGTTSTTFTGCLYMSGSATGTLSTGGAVTGCLKDFTVRGTGATVLQQAPNRSGLVNNTTGNIVTIADCTDFRVEGITFDGVRDTVAPMTPLTASASSGQPSVTVAAGQGARYLAGQNLYVFGGLGTGEQNQSEGFGVGTGTPLVVQSVTAGGGSGGGDLVTFTTNLANSYAQISSTPFTDGFGPYAYAGAYLTSYQCGSSNSVAGRSLSGEDQQNGLHLISCQRFTITRCTARNLWESGIKCGTGFASGSLTDGCQQGSITGCTAYHGYDQGVSVWVSQNVNVGSCVTAAAGWAGVCLTASDNCTVTGCQAVSHVYRVPQDDNSGSGFVTEGGISNTITGNVAEGCFQYGIQVIHSPLGWGIVNGSEPTTSTFLSAGTAAGTSVQVSATGQFRVAGRYSILDGPRTEAVSVRSVVDGTHVTFNEILQFSHASGVKIGHRVAQANTVAGNTVLSSGAQGILLVPSVRTCVSGNTVGGSGSAGIAADYQAGFSPSSAYPSGDGSVITGNVVGNGSGPAIKAAGVADVQIQGNRVDFPGGNGSAIELDGVVDSLISENHLTEIIGGYGIIAENGGSPSIPCARLTIAGNVILRSSGHPGISVQNGDSLTISGNEVSSCGGTAGIDLIGVTRSVISGNVSNSNNAIGIHVGDNGANHSQYNRIIGNTCRDDGSGYKITTGGTWTQQHGIVEDGSSNNNLFTGNECDANAIDQLTTVGAASYSWANVISGSPSGGLPVALGGTGDGTLTAYALLAGGTTSAGALQQVASLGNSGQVLTSSGAAALPSFANQNYAGVFGDGSDLSVTFDGSTTVLGLVPSGSAYTMTRDIYCTSITINNGVTLKPSNWRIFCAGTLTNNGTIGQVANAGSAGGSAGTGGNSNSIVNGSSGQAGVTSGTGSNATARLSAGVGNGGNGGNGTTGGPGSGGTGSGVGTGIYKTLPAMSYVVAGSVIALGGGNGGGGGAGDGANSGGGGGAGGSTIVICAYSVINNGTITASGGAGGSPAAGNTGGGGGGGGGLILVFTLSAWTAGTTNVAGGALGTGHGSGTSGGAGNSGSVVNVVLI